MVDPRQSQKKGGRTRDEQDGLMVERLDRPGKGKRSKLEGNTKNPVNQRYVEGISHLGEKQYDPDCNPPITPLLNNLSTTSQLNAFPPSSHPKDKVFQPPISLAANSKVQHLSPAIQRNHLASVIPRPRPLSFT